ncbi:MAG: recombination mediator RecR [Planctomycetota bacterium]|jgi:recombination protein RecR
MAKNPEYSASMDRLIERFARLPGIGRRTAERLAFHILKSNKDEALALAGAISDVKNNVRHCSVCYNLTETDPCPICADDKRDRSKILVVEQPRDVISLEQTHSYTGLYHVLLGHIAPLDGVQPADLTIHALIERVHQATPEHPLEIILGTNPNLEGDGTALHIAQHLEGLPDVRVSRLARGLPAGTELQYANKAVLSDAINSRHDLS